MSAPIVLWIRRLEGGSTTHIGTSAHLSERCQFFGCVVAPTLTTPGTEVSSKRRKKQDPGPWYAVLHRFKLSGAYVGTDSWCAGAASSSPGDSKARAEERLASWLAQLRFVSLQDIHIRAFSVEIDGHVFGLIRENATRNTAILRLLPLNLVFQSPWTGYPAGEESAA
jgi:formate hydrogenlyase regulatory protein HycA